MPFSLDSTYGWPRSGTGMTPAAASAGFHASSLSDVRQTCPPRGPVRMCAGWKEPSGREPS